MNIINAFNVVKARVAVGCARTCAACGRRLGRFLPYQGGRYRMPALMSALDVVGSDLSQFECPWCGAHDRERHLFLYMRASGLLDQLSQTAVLHFAPERRLTGVIGLARPRVYIKGDLYPNAPDVQRMDLLAVPFDAESFDLVIANHVLEHVSDDRAAVREIFRVLRPGGYAILQTPFSAKLQRTWSDPGIDDAPSRLHAYGQEDHVRLFGSDIFDRIAESGLVPCIAVHAELLADFDAARYGVNPREPFFLFRRPVAA